MISHSSIYVENVVNAFFLQSKFPNSGSKYNSNFYEHCHLIQNHICIRIF